MIRNKEFILLLITFLWISLLQAQIPERPTPPKLVNDFAGVLSPDQINSLENSLVQFDRETSTQIVIVTVKDLQGYDPGDFAFRIGESWGVGQKGKNNGVVILVKPKTDNEKGRIFIATGYGLEGVLPDAVVNGAVIDNEIIPHFRQNDYYKGLESGVKVIMDITRGEYTAEYYQENYAKDTGVPGIVIIFITFFVFFIMRSRKQRFYSPGKNLPLWIALGMLSGKHSHRGTFSDFSSGSGGFSGGFGGFGGGSFGGGGAGGSW
ncbi:MAG: TPM domain-containing protein [Prolixibacteraceae bacterium]|nr:TPM domain-containing protein [Prolixibacteraceae bacterium]